MQIRRLFGIRPRRDERGVILVMAVPGLVLALVAMALSVDIGRQVFEKRSDQSIADAAALDAARVPANAQALAEASARRNGFDPAASGHSLVAQRGTVDAQRVFTPAAAGNAVLVTISSHMDYIFVPGDKTVTARAAATMGGGKQGGFTLGTSLASVDSSKSPLLNAVLGRMMGGSGVTADVVGWQGLVNSHITLEALRQELELLDAGVQFGTVDQLLASDITMAKLAQASANALTKKGDSNASLFLGPTGIIAKSTNTATFKLGDMIKVAEGSGASALATEFDVFGLVTGGAMLANGTNTVSIPNIGITIPNVGNVSLSLKVIEVPQHYVGPDITVNPPAPGEAHAKTGQVELTLTPTLNVPVSVTGLVGTTVTGALPVQVTAAGATANLTSITCPNPNGGERVTVDLKPVSSSASAPLTVTASVLTFPITFNSTTTGAGVVDAPPAALDFSYPTEFTPPGVRKRVGASPLGLGTMTTFSSTVTLGPLPVIPALLQGTVNATLATATPLVGPAVNLALPGVLNNLSTLVMKPLLDTLGVSIGAADVTAPKMDFVTTCGLPVRPSLVN